MTTKRLLLVAGLTAYLGQRHFVRGFRRQCLVLTPEQALALYRLARNAGSIDEDDIEFLQAVQRRVREMK